MGLFPLHKLFTVKRFWASSYQAVSGSGIKGMQELVEQTMTCGQTDILLNPNYMTIQ